MAGQADGIVAACCSGTEHLTIELSSTRTSLVDDATVTEVRVSFGTQLSKRELLVAPQLKRLLFLIHQNFSQMCNLLSFHAAIYSTFVCHKFFLVRLYRFAIA